MSPLLVSDFLATPFYFIFCNFILKERTMTRHKFEGTGKLNCKLFPYLTGSNPKKIFTCLFQSLKSIGTKLMQKKISIWRAKIISQPWSQTHLTISTILIAFRKSYSSWSLIKGTPGFMLVQLVLRPTLWWYSNSN